MGAFVTHQDSAESILVCLLLLATNNFMQIIPPGNCGLKAREVNEVNRNRLQLTVCDYATKSSPCTILGHLKQISEPGYTHQP